MKSKFTGISGRVDAVKSLGSIKFGVIVLVY